MPVPAKAISAPSTPTSTTPVKIATKMNATAAHVAHDVSEFKIAGLTAVPSKLVNVPRVAESPVSFECKLTQINTL